MWKRVSILALGALLASGAALADRPDWAGGKHGKHHEEHERDHDRDEHHKHGKHFDDRHVVVVREYYVHEIDRGYCPPGLAKKHNGCLPPGQAKKWEMGRPIPRGVVVYELPPTLVVKLGIPAPGYKYVRVAADILLVAVGTNMVVDAVRDLGRM